jgi:acyl-CoA synthetase (NDP forming)
LVDLAEAEGVEFTPITEQTTAKLAEVLEPGLDPINPLDAWGTGNASEDIYTEALRALDADPSTGLTLFAVDLYVMDDPDSFYPTIVRSMQHELRNPLAFLVHMSGAASEKQTAQLREMGIPVLMGTENGLRASRAARLRGRRTSPSCASSWSARRVRSTSTPASGSCAPTGSTPPRRRSPARSTRRCTPPGRSAIRWCSRRRAATCTRRSAAACV